MQSTKKTSWGSRKGFDLDAVSTMRWTLIAIGITRTKVDAENHGFEAFLGIVEAVKVKLVLEPAIKTCQDGVVMALPMRIISQPMWLERGLGLRLVRCLHGL